MDQFRLISLIVPTAGDDPHFAAHIDRLSRHPAAAGLQVIVVTAGHAGPAEQALADRPFAATKVIAQRDLSQPDAINLGAAAATGRALTWLNTDDILARDAVDHVHAALEGAPAKAIVYGRAFQVREGKAPSPYPVATAVSTAGLFQACCLSQPATWITPAAWKALGGLRSRFDCGFDYDLWIRASKAGVPFRFVGAPLADMTLRADAKSFRRRPRVFQEQAELLMLHYGRCPPGVLAGLWWEAIEPAEGYERVSADILEAAPTTLSAIAAIAERTGDSETLTRLENDMRLVFLSRGLAAEVDAEGRFEDNGRLRMLAQDLPISLLIRFDQPPASMDEVAVVMVGENRPAQACLFPAAKAMAVRVEAPKEANGAVATLSFLSTDALGARLVGMWRI